LDVEERESVEGLINSIVSSCSQVGRAGAIRLLLKELERYTSGIGGEDCEVVRQGLRLAMSRLHSTYGNAIRAEIQRIISSF